MKILIFDTETTGLIQNHSIPLNKQPEVTEFYGAVVDLKTGRRGKTIDTLIRPAAFPISPETIKATKTKITNQMLSDQPTFKELADPIKELIETSPAVIAHNATFDREMINIEFERLNFVVKWPRVFCSVELTMHVKRRRCSLTNLHEYLFDEAFADAHRAGPDTQALIRCVREMFKRGWIPPL